MKNGKYSRKGSKRIVTLLLALVLILGCGIGGTLAYLFSTPDEVTNTFVVGDIGTLDITETDTDDSVDGDQHDYVIIPGVDIKKDPAVVYTPATVTSDTTTVPVYVFVKIEAADWANDDDTDVYYIQENVKNAAGEEVATKVVSWTVNTTEWTRLEKGVYYKLIDGKTETTIPVMVELDPTAKTTIDVSSDITKEMVTSVAGKADDIKFTAYAIQEATFENNAAGAWNAVKTA